MERDTEKMFPRTGLSAGMAVYEALTRSEAVTSRVTDIYPVQGMEVNFPAVCYRIAEITPTETFDGPSDTVGVEVFCMASGYVECMEISEAVRAALEDLRGATACGIDVCSCALTGYAEEWQGDAFVRLLIFKLEI